jgi:hypothetical protein
MGTRRTALADVAIFTQSECASVCLDEHPRQRCDGNENPRIDHYGEDLAVLDPGKNQSPAHSENDRRLVSGRSHGLELIELPLLAERARRLRSLASTTIHRWTQTSSSSGNPGQLVPSHLSRLALPFSNNNRFRQKIFHISDYYRYFIYIVSYVRRYPSSKLCMFPLVGEYASLFGATSW